MNIKTVRDIALSLPEAEDRSDGDMLHFYVRGKHFAWTYLEPVDAKRPRQPRPDVLVVRCAAEAKDSLLTSDPDTFFTTDHYRGFPAILVRLDKIGAKDLRSLLTAAWLCQAPRALARRVVRPKPRHD